MSGPANTIGILYAGEMGASLGRALAAKGHRVVTTLHGRSPRTARLCREANLALLDSEAEVIRESEVLFSLVPPAAAQDLARTYARLAHLSPPSALYVETNSIAPQSACALAKELASTSRGFVDASINGLAKNLTISGTLFLSGPRASEVAALAAGAMRVRILGPHIGQASAMKMLLGGLSKGLCALFLELALVARNTDMLAPMLEEAAAIYPGMTLVTDRMIPTYAQHAARRETEMSELLEMAQSAGLEPRVIAAVTALHHSLAAVPMDAGEQSVEPFINHLAALGFLAAGGKRNMTHVGESR